MKYIKTFETFVNEKLTGNFTFDSDLYWSNWKRKHGSVTSYAKEIHDMIELIMSNKQNTLAQDQLENYSLEELKIIKEDL